MEYCLIGFPFLLLVVESEQVVSWICIQSLCYSILFPTLMCYVDDLPVKDFFLLECTNL